MILIEEVLRPDLYTDVDKGIDFCRSIPDAKLNRNIEFHAFWIGDFGRKQSLPIKSFFATQTDNFAKLNLWSTQDLSKNEFLKPFKDKIKFRHWNPIEEAKGTLIENLSDLKASDSRRWVDGDLFRLLVLHKYGGVYFDMDVVFLRDFTPLLDQEFMYKWGPENMINGAIMHLKKESKLTFDLLNELSKRRAIPNSTCWGNDTYMSVRSFNKNWTIFPAAFFNSEWVITPDFYKKYPGMAVGRLEPFKKCEQSFYLFEGAFSWHWHGRWDESIEDGSKWQILELKTNKLLLDKGFLQ